MAHLLESASPSWSFSSTAPLEMLPTELFERVAEHLDDSSDLKALRQASRECYSKSSKIYTSSRLANFTVDLRYSRELEVGLEKASDLKVLSTATRVLTIITDGIATSESEDEKTRRTQLLTKLLANLRRFSAVYIHIRIDADTWSECPSEYGLAVADLEDVPDWDSIDHFMQILRSVAASGLLSTGLSIDPLKTLSSIVDVDGKMTVTSWAISTEALGSNDDDYEVFKSVIGHVRSLSLPFWTPWRSAGSVARERIADAIAAAPSLSHLCLILPHAHLQDMGLDEELQRPWVKHPVVLQLLDLSMPSLREVEVIGGGIVANQLIRFVNANAVRKVTLENSLVHVRARTVALWRTKYKVFSLADSLSTATGAEIATDELMEEEFSQRE